MDTGTLINLFQQPAIKSRITMLLGFSAVLSVMLVAILLPLLPALTFSSAKDDRTEATKKAMEIYGKQKAAGISFDDGPCLSEDLMTDWVADIAHKPRQPVDDQPEHQCQSYRQGKARHFVELDPEGNVLSAQ